MIRGFFTMSSPNDVEDAIVISEWGTALASLHWKVNNEAPATDMWGHSIWSYINAPRVGMMAVRSVAGVELTTPIPCILADIWIQLNSSAATLAFCPFLSPLKKMTGIIDNSTQVTALGAGAYSIPTTADGQAREIGMYSVPTAIDNEIFNARLTWHGFIANLYSTDGNIWATSTVTSGRMVCQKTVVPDFTVPELVYSSVPAAKTNWMPYCTNTGLRLIVGVTAANDATRLTQVMTGRAFTGLTTWVFKNVEIVPNVIVGSTATKKHGLWSSRAQGHLKDSSTSSPAGSSSNPDGV
jgi:hypothetical protein